MRLGGTGPNADLVYGGTDLKTQRQMALRKKALEAAQTAHPGMFSPEEVELATHDDKAYDALIARREGILKAEQDVREREGSLSGAVGLDGKPLSETTIKQLARSLPAYNKFLDLQLNPPKDAVAIHKAEREFDVEHPTKAEAGTKWQVQSTTNGSGAGESGDRRSASADRRRREPAQEAGHGPRRCERGQEQGARRPDDGFDA
jgi:hypothetical protein